MLMFRIYSILADAEDAPLATRPHAMSLSDLQQGFQTAHDTAATDHTLTYAILTILAGVAVIATLAWIVKRLGLEGSLVRVINALGIPLGGRQLVLPQETDAPENDQPRIFGVICPNWKCQSILLVPEESRGRNVRCSHCKALVKIPASVTGKTRRRSSCLVSKHRHHVRTSCV